MNANTAALRDLVNNKFAGINHGVRLKARWAVTNSDVADVEATDADFAARLDSAAASLLAVIGGPFVTINHDAVRALDALRAEAHAIVVAHE